MKKLSMVAGLLLAGYAANSFATGGDAQTSFNVTATINPVCLVQANDLDFTTYDPLSSSPKDVSTTMSVTCSGGASYTVNLDGGSNNTGGGSANARNMLGSDGTSLLAYNLYSDTYGGTVWGNGTNDANGVTGTGSGTADILTVYGVLPGSQTSAADGSYNDIITVDVIY